MAKKAKARSTASKGKRRPAKRTKAKGGKKPQRKPEKRTNPASLWLVEARRLWEEGHSIIAGWVMRWFDTGEPPPLDQYEQARRGVIIERGTDALGLTDCHKALRKALRNLTGRIDVDRAAPWMVNPPLTLTLPSWPERDGSTSADTCLRAELRSLANKYPQTDPATIAANRDSVIAKIEEHARKQRKWFDEEQVIASGTKATDDGLPRLSEPEEQVWKHLLANPKGQTGKEIVKDFNFVFTAESLRNHIIPGLIAKGRIVKNDRNRRGYYPD